MFHQDKLLAAHRAGDVLVYMMPWLNAVERMIKAGIQIHEINTPLTCECHKDKLMHIRNDDGTPFTWDEIKHIVPTVAAGIVTMHDEDCEAVEGDPLPPS